MKIPIGTGDIDIFNHQALTITHNYHVKCGMTPFDYLMIEDGGYGIWESEEDKRKATVSGEIWKINVCLPYGEKNYFGATLLKALDCWRKDVK